MCFEVRSFEVTQKLVYSWNIPESYLPSLATCCENIVLNSERIMEKSINFQIIYAGRTNLSKQNNWPLTKLAIPQPPHYPVGVKRVHVNRLNVEGTVFQTFLNYKQRSCIRLITNEQVKLISFMWEGSISRWEYVMHLYNWVMYGMTYRYQNTVYP